MERAAIFGGPSLNEGREAVRHSRLRWAAESAPRDLTWRIDVKESTGPQGTPNTRMFKVNR